MPLSLFSRRSFGGFLLFASITLAMFTSFAATGDPLRGKPRPAVVVQDQSVKSEKVNYDGTVVFEDSDKNKLEGKAKLYLDGRRFTLTYGSRKYDGELITLMSGGQPGGSIRFKNDREISIKWTQDPQKPSRLKIVSARGACIKFRFCSNDVSRTECNRSLTPG